MKVVLHQIEKNFLAIVLIFSAIGFFFPNTFIDLKSYIPFLLGVIMLGMGLTLNFSDLIGVGKQPKWIFVGVALQFILMPLLAFGIGKLLQLPQELLIGLVIVGSCPGGTASNVMVYLAKGNISLSVIMTLVSTLLAPVLTPFWIYSLVGESIDVSFFALIKTTFWIVIFPLIDGLVLRRLFEKKIQPIIAIFPSISIFSIALIIACVVGLNHETLKSFPLLVILAVVLHNLTGFFSGYGIAKALKFPKDVCKTIAFEVGMQNSGLGVTLALLHFSKIIALPSVLFSVWHNVAGISFVKVFKRKD
ncbi:bile acid:sodium symporter family protein [Wenyingzhuangia sp. IMCC45574]